MYRGKRIPVKATLEEDWLFRRTISTGLLASFRGAKDVLNPMLQEFIRKCLSFING